MVNIAICDDDRKAGQAIKSVAEICCRKVKGLYGLKVFEKSSQLLYEVEEGGRFDILILDIELPRTDGMALAEKVKSFLPDVIVIFVTAYEKYVYESFKVGPYRFVPKTQMDSMLPSALEGALRLAVEQEGRFYVVENRKILEKIPVKSIAYIWHQGKYAYIEKTDGGSIKVRKSLKQVFAELPAEDFVWVDRGYIAGLLHIERIAGNEVILTNGMRLSVSQDRLADLKGQVRAYWMERG